MAITLRSELADTGTTNGTTGQFTVLRPSTVESGDWLIVAIGKDDDPAITPPGTWTEGDVIASTADNDIFAGVWYRYVADIATEPSTYTFTGDVSEEFSYWIASLGGVDIADFEDVEFTGRLIEQLNDTTPDAPTITPATDGALVIAIWYTDGDTSVTRPGGAWQNRALAATAANVLAVSSQVVAAVGPTGDASLSGVTSTADTVCGLFAIRPNTSPNYTLLTMPANSDTSLSADATANADVLLAADLTANSDTALPADLTANSDTGLSADLDANTDMYGSA